MGMQVLFSAKDVPDDMIIGQFNNDGAKEAHSWALVTRTGYIFHAYGDGKDFWFDVGHADSEQMTAIEWLIHNRINFTCS